MVNKRDKQTKPFVVGAPSGTQDNHIPAMLQKGHRLHQSGNLKDAQTAYQEILRLYPNQPDATYLLGTLALQTGNLKPAVKLLSRAVSLSPDQPMYHFALGNALFHDQQPEESIDCFRKALALAPDMHDAHNNIGNVLTSLGRLDEAIASYRQAVSVNPAFPQAHCNLGHALHGAGRQEEALACYRKAIEIAPGLAEVHNNMGVALKDLGRLDEAAECFLTALQINSGNADVHNNLGAVYLSMGRRSDAIDSFRTATSIAPNFINAHFNTGEALLADNQTGKAVESFEATLRLAPMHVDALVKLGDAYRKLGRIEEAADCYRKANTPHAQANALECLFSLKQEDAFYDYLEQLVPQEDANLRVASISAFAAHQFGRSDPYPFCPSPMDCIRIRNLFEREESNKDLLHEILAELAELDSRWEPKGKTTQKGYQSDNIFLKPTGKVSSLMALITGELGAYREELMNETCDYIRRWPEDVSLGGWFVRLLQGGHQSTHTHPLGWVSGVVYLKVPPGLPGDEGAIEFSIHGNDYPIIDDSFPSKRHHPREGELVLFPSSLHHRTMPFNADEERVCIAFDMMPVREPR